MASALRQRHVSLQKMCWYSPRNDRSLTNVLKRALCRNLHSFAQSQSELSPRRRHHALSGLNVPFGVDLRHRQRLVAEYDLRHF